MKKIFYLIFALVFVACSSKVSSSRPEEIPNFDDFLGMGQYPTPPAVQESNFSLVDKPMLSKQVSEKMRSMPANAFSPTQTSDPVAIFSATGGTLTLWSLKESAWVWGYTPFDSLSFGEARNWRVITFANGEVSFKNEMSGFCLASYGNGVIHIRCNASDDTQKWSFIFFKNQAVQLKNKANGRCLQTPEIRNRTWYDIFTVDCVKEGGENLDQQWYIIPPLKRTTPVFTFN